MRVEVCRAGFFESGLLHKSAARFFELVLISDATTVDYIVGIDKQPRREKNSKDFMAGKFKVLVATMEVAGWSHTFTGLELIIFYDQPASLAVYERCLARIGKLGKPGRSIMFRKREEDPPVGDWATFLHPYPVPESLLNASTDEETYS